MNGRGHRTRDSLASVVSGEVLQMRRAAFGIVEGGAIVFALTAA